MLYLIDRNREFIESVCPLAFEHFLLLELKEMNSCLRLFVARFTISARKNKKIRIAEIKKTLN